jgi:hypothetical protein
MISTVGEARPDAENATAAVIAEVNDRRRTASGLISGGPGAPTTRYSGASSAFRVSASYTSPTVVWISD